MPHAASYELGERMREKKERKKKGEENGDRGTLSRHVVARVYKRASAGECASYIIDRAIVLNNVHGRRAQVLRPSAKI